MLFYLFLLFTIVPLIELTILIRIGNLTAWWVPILMVIGTGIAGTALARWQGWQVVQRIRAESSAGRVPTDALIDGVLIFIAGVLLVTPGVMSDLVGVGLLVPPIRSLVKRRVAAWIKRNVEVRMGRATAGIWPEGQPAPPSQDEIIDARVIGTRVEDVE